METIQFDLLHSWWDGKVKVRKIKPFEDDRGLLGEIFRQDSDSFKNIVNTYISETRPLIKRGPHEHTFQDDEFITWNSEMVYEFYNHDAKESKFFITEPNGIYSIYVEHNIHHGYRNISTNDISYTLNSLNKLYKGVGRTEEADEIRHEKKTVDNKILFVFGAKGKLGRALVDVAYKSMGEHQYEVIPCFEKIKNIESFESFKSLLDSRFSDKKLTFFNCAGITRTKESGPMNDEWNWTNVELPLLLAEMCSEHGWEFVQISSNYVYQLVKLGAVNFHVSRYTQSKKNMEAILHAPNNKERCRTTTVIRVANLYNDSLDDVNIFTRFKDIIKTTGSISVEPTEMVTPTNVNILSEKLVELFKSGEFNVVGIKRINILSESFTLDEFVKKNFGITPNTTTNMIDHGFNSFKSDYNAKIIHI
jgi:dTDP-4-dehydrorhamnose reductase